MKRKKSNKANIQATDNKKPTTPPKKWLGYLPRISYAYSAILTLITLYTWFPTFTIDPQTMYFDGDHDTLKFIVKNNSFIPVKLVDATYEIKDLKINDNFNFSDNKITIYDGNYLFSNKPRAIFFRVFKINLQSIKEIKKSDLCFKVTYMLPLIPIPFTEDHNFSAIKESQVSIKWLPK